MIKLINFQLERGAEVRTKKNIIKKTKFLGKKHDFFLLKLVGNKFKV